MSSTQAGGDSRTEQVKETAQQATDQARQTAQQATEQARGRVRDEVDRRSTDAGRQAGDVAEAFRQSAQQLREHGKGNVAGPVEQAADRVQRAGAWLERSNGDDILRDVEDFGRSKPLAVLAGGAVAGFALSRLLKASSSRRYQQSTSAAGATTTGPYGQPGYPEPLPPSTPEPPITRPPGTAGI